MRRVLGACTIAAALAVAACAGNNGTSNVPPISGQSHVRTQSAPAASTATVGGSINAVTSSVINFTMTNPSNCTGKDDVYYVAGSPKTDPANATPPPTGYVQVTGVESTTPLPCRQVTTSNYITYSSSPIPQVNLSGAVTKVDSDGSFYVDDAGVVSLVVTNSYSSNVSAQVGQNATVQGYGFTGAGHFVHATSVSLSTPQVNKHAFTWDYGDYGYMKTSDHSYPSKGLPWLTMAQVSPDPLSSPNVVELHNAGVKLEKYTDGIIAQGGSKPNQVFLDDGGVANQVPQSSTNFYHDCNGNAIVTTEDKYTQYEQDFSKSAVIANNKKDTVGSDFPEFNYLFMDGASEEGNTVSVASPYPAATPCGVSDTQFHSTLVSGYNQLGPPVIVNGLSSVDYHHALPCPCLTVAEGVAGGRMEGSYICPPSGSCLNTAPNGGAGYTDPAVWQAQENTEIDMSNAGKLLLLEEYDLGVTPWSSYGMAHRMFGFASYYLTYNLADTGIFYGADGFTRDADTNNTTGARLYPESEIVPLNPLKPEPGTNGIASLADTGGAYFREYQDCYIAGSRVGTCIVVVNPNGTSSVPFPASAHYPWVNCSTCHQLVMHNGSNGGAEITEGGTITEDGPAPPSSIAPDGAYIVFNTAM